MPVPAYQKPVLLVDDDALFLETLEAALQVRGFHVIVENGPAHALERIRADSVEIVVSDMSMPGMNGLELLGKIREQFPEVLMILMTAFGTEKIAVTAMKQGAFDYLSKPFEMDELGLILERAAEKLSLVSENRRLSEELRQYVDQPQMAGNSLHIERIREIVRRIAPSDVTVLITGESGTGKELVAQALFQQSHRHASPFVKINCTALPETLLESELFGHERGSFTGAYKRQIGKFEMANTGTVFLDEIGDISLATQTKLLRVIQEQTFERIGGKETLQVDVRLVAATNRNLQEEIRKGNFREDLYYRLNVIEVYLPPLRERREDIPLLIDRFLDDFTRKYKKPKLSLPKETLAHAMSYGWPGNIRQLKNWVERMVVLGFDEKGDAFEPDFMSLPQASGQQPALQEGALVSLEEAEGQYIKRVLDATGGNKLRAARILRIDPKTLRTKLRKLTGAEDAP
ncbi:MAG: sigma-54-dependent Fis family transcriptional regulator [Candidatus Wallbacteria bacterium]|nr:sigma-54-dependent Fis family transcriptional regulator [Candidatus Wallbacteria bacterium]